MRVVILEDGTFIEWDIAGKRLRRMWGPDVGWPGGVQNWIAFARIDAVPGSPLDVEWLDPGGPTASPGIRRVVYADVEWRGDPVDVPCPEPTVPPVWAVGR